MPNRAADELAGEAVAGTVTGIAGRAGKMALGPLLGQSRRDVWELQQMAEKAELG